MRKVEEKRFEVLEVVCDKCNRTYTDSLETQECLHYADTAGYGNKVMDDGARWSIDLCQYCIRDLLGPYLRKHHNMINGVSYEGTQGIDGEGEVEQWRVISSINPDEIGLTRPL